MATEPLFHNVAASTDSHSIALPAGLLVSLIDQVSDMASEGGLIRIRAVGFRKSFLVQGKYRRSFQSETGLVQTVSGMLSALEGRVSYLITPITYDVEFHTHEPPGGWFQAPPEFEELGRFEGLKNVLGMKS